MSLTTITKQRNQTVRYEKRILIEDVLSDGKKYWCYFDNTRIELKIYDTDDRSKGYEVIPNSVKFAGDYCD